MRNDHARRNRFLLALFFGVLSVLFGASSAQAANLPAGCGTGFPPVACTWIDHGSYYSATKTVAVGDYLQFPTGTGHDLVATTSSVCSDLSTMYSPEFAHYQGFTSYSCTATSAGTLSVRDYGPYDASGNDTASTTGDYAPYDASGVVFGVAAASASPVTGDLPAKLVGMFTGYVIPLVLVALLAVVAFKLITKHGTRYLNRA